MGPAREVKRAPAREPETTVKRTRGFRQALDPMSQDIHETYTRKLEQLHSRYPEMNFQSVMKKLLGRDVERDA